MAVKKDYREIVNAMLEYLTTRSPVTDTSVGSVSRTLVEAFGLEIARLYDEMEAAYNAGFIDTAQGKALELVVAILGISRKSPAYATGTVTFRRRNPVRDVTIPSGTRVSTRATDPTKAKIFETTTTAYLPKGQTEIEVPIRALIPGEAGVADFETITELETPIIGIDSVINKKPTTIGTERESDEELRARAKATILSAGKATVDALRNAVLGIPGVRSVVINEMPDGVPGEVDLIIDGLELTDRQSPQYLLVESVVNRYRPVGICVNIKGTKLVKISVEVFISLKATVRTGVEEENAVNAVKDAITNHLNSLKTGEQLVRNQLISAILAVPDVYNVDDLTLSAKVYDEKMHMFIDETRRRVDSQTSNLYIGPYERISIENIIVYTQYTPRVITYVECDFNILITLSSKYISERKVKENIENMITQYFENLKAGDAVNYDILCGIVKSIEGVDMLNKLEITAIYEDTGLIVSGATHTIKVSSRERARVRNISIAII
jgi:uncharacterized phage protein gp47/JayE